MRVLITGCYGQVGSCLTKQLANNENTTVLALDREHLDITNQDAVDAAVAEFEPSIIINAAAYTAVDKAEEEVDLSYAINRDGPKYLAQAAQSVGAAMLHISTDYVYEGNKTGEYVETDAKNLKGFTVKVSSLVKLPLPRRVINTLSFVRHGCLVKAEITS